MIKPILVYGDPILRKLSDNIGVGADVDEIIQDLWDTMYNADGAGLAGPQIGKLKRIFVIDLPDQEWKGVFINPSLKTSDENVSMNEGCLSIPGVNAPIVRPKNITIEYYDEKWKLHRESYTGIKSRVIQHEYEHLDGVLWVDRISQFDFYPILPKLRAIKDKDFNADYPTA